MDDGGDLLDGIALVIVEVDRLAVFQGQGHDAFKDAFRAGLELVLGGPRRCYELGDVVERDGRASRLAPEEVFRGVDGDADDPGALVLRRFEALRTVEGLEEDVLADVFGILRAVQVGVAHAQDRVGVCLDEPVRLRLYRSARRASRRVVRRGAPAARLARGRCSPNFHVLTSLS